MAISFSANPEAISRLPRALAFRHDALPLSVVDGVLAVALADPDDPVLIDVLRATTRLRIRALSMPRETIRQHLRVAYGEAPAASTLGDHGDAPAVRAVDLVFARAVAAHASDIHIEPHPGGGRVRFRVDGILRDAETIPADLFAAFTSRVKLVASMDISDRRQPQDGRCGIPYDSREIDARVASLPTIGGERIVVRLLDRYAAAPDLATLGMAAELLERFRSSAQAPWGFVVVSGPTGSGKTTTLYASLSELDRTSRNVCSVEDPIEMRLAGVSQVQVNARSGLTFPLVLRAFMRQDPNVVMVGEMRDSETASVAVAAALSGQMVFTTLHANDAPRTVDRLLQLGIDRHSLAAAISAVLAQRLVRVLCEHCRVRESIPLRLRAALHTEQDHWYAARGCRACAGSGFLGRTGVYELMDVDNATRDAIATGGSSVHVAAVAASAGYRPMAADALAKVLAGVTSFDEMARVVAWNPAR